MAGDQMWAGATPIAYLDGIDTHRGQCYNSFCALFICSAKKFVLHLQGSHVLTLASSCDGPVVAAAARA